jgi:hypothetical protein
VDADAVKTRLKRIVPVVPFAQKTTSVRSYSLAAAFWKTMAAAVVLAPENI